MRRYVVRGLVVVVLDAVALLILSALLSGFQVHGVRGAIGTAVVVGVLNALVGPVLNRLALPLSVMTLGLGSLVLDGALVALAAAISPGATIAGLGAGIIVGVGIAIVTTVVSSLLAIDDDDSWQRNVVRRQARIRGEFVRTDVPGVIFLEIDGLAHEVLRRAMRDGNAPTLSRWLREGTHRVERWETDWSSQTGACQAGLLHGNNDDMPAFRWWEKDRGAAIVTNHPRDAEEIERRHSDGQGLLYADGASRANILSGDAPHTMLTMSTVRTRRGPIGRDYAAYFARPYAVVRTSALVIAEIARERRAASRQVRDDVEPRIARSRTYAAVRAWATVIQRDLQIATVVGDMSSCSRPSCATRTTRWSARRRCTTGCAGGWRSSARTRMRRRASPAHRHPGRPRSAHPDPRDPGREARCGEALGRRPHLGRAAGEHDADPHVRGRRRHDHAGGMRQQQVEVGGAGMIGPGEAADG